MSRRGNVIMQLGQMIFLPVFHCCILLDTIISLKSISQNFITMHINPYGLGGITVVANSVVELKVAKITYVRQLLETDLELSARFYKFIARLVSILLKYL